VVLPLNIIQNQMSVWDEDVDGDDFPGEMHLIQKCYEVLTHRVSNFSTEYNKAKNKPINDPKGAAKILMEGIRLGENLLDDKLALENREGGISSEKLIEFVQSQYEAYTVSDAVLNRTKDQPETQQYREVRDAMSSATCSDAPDAGKLTVGLIELKHAYTLYKQMVKRLAPPPAAPAPSPKAVASSSSSSSPKKQKKKEESDDEMEVEEKPKTKAKKPKVEKKKRPVSDDDEEEEEEEKPKAKKAKAEPAPSSGFSFGGPQPTGVPGFSFKKPLPVSTLDDSAKLLSGAGMEWMVSKTQQLLKKDAQAMVDFIGAIQNALQPASLQAIANKTNQVFVDKLTELTAAIKKCD